MPRSGCRREVRAHRAAIVERCGNGCEGARSVVLEGLAAHLAAQGRSRELARVRSTLTASEERTHLRLQVPPTPPPGFDVESQASSAWLP